MRRISLPVLALTLGGLAAGALCAVLTSQGIHRFEVEVSFPNHPYGYLFSPGQLLVLGCGLGGTLGFAQSLALRRTGLLPSAFLAFGLTTLLIALAYGVRFHAAPDGVRILHMVVGAASLSLPPLLIPALLIDGVGLPRFRTKSAAWILPAYILLQALSGWTFWQFLIPQRTDHVFGWLNGAVYGSIQSAILVFLARRIPAETAAPADPRGWGRPAIVLGGMASLLWLTVSALSWDRHRDRVLELEAADRRLVLTIDDLKGLRGFRDAQGYEQASKIRKGERSLVLKYRYGDPGSDVWIESQAILAVDLAEASFSHRMVDQAMIEAFSVPPDRWTWDEDPQFVRWGGTSKAIRVVDGDVLRGVIFSGYRGRVAVFMAVAARREGLDAEAVARSLQAVLERLPK